MLQRTCYDAQRAIDESDDGTAVALAQARDLKMIVRIEHAAGVRSIVQELQSIELLMFGHPKGRKPLLRHRHADTGCDAALKRLAYTLGRLENEVAQPRHGACWAGSIPGWSA